MRRKEVDAKTDVVNIAKYENAAMLAIGFHGRKAESKIKEGGHTLLGSSVEHNINFSPIPFLVCKMKYEQKNHFIFGVCVDGSYKSYEALQFTMKLVNPDDKVIAMYSPHIGKPKLIQQLGMIRDKELRKQHKKLRELCMSKSNQIPTQAKN